MGAEKLEDEEGAPKVNWTGWADAKNAGKVVEFSEPSSPPSAENAPPEKEPLSKKRVAYILEDLQMYCEEMLGIEGERTETWAERADALTAAIAVLRK